MPPVISYSTSTAAAGKRVVSPARPQEVDLSDLLDGALVAELQLCLRQGHETTDVLATCGSHLAKLAKDLLAVEEANTHLQYEVKCLKDVALEDKAAAKTSQEELITARSQLEALKVEKKSLDSALKDRHEVFSPRGKEIGVAFATSLARVHAYVPSFKSVS